MQIVIAGKSHPADDNGKRLIQQMVRFADDPEVRHRIAILPNYDIGMALTLYPGCDVWLNNPLRPLEACGTSGMKAALNGGLNLSIRDGWWDEWFDGENGWAIPTADGVDDPEHRDDLEAAALYDLIEKLRRAAVLRPRPARPAAALARDGAAHAVLARPQGARHPDGRRLRAQAVRAGGHGRTLGHRRTPPAASPPSRSACAPNGAPSGSTTWSRSDVGEAPQVGDEIRVRAFVTLGAQLAPRDVDVQLVYGRVSPSDTLTDLVTAPLQHVEEIEPGRHRFEGSVRLRRTGPFGYTVRVLPHVEGAAGPAELALVTNAVA